MKEITCRCSKASERKSKEKLQERRLIIAVHDAQAKKKEAGQWNRQKEEGINTPTGNSFLAEGTPNVAAFVLSPINDGLQQ